MACSPASMLRHSIEQASIPAHWHDTESSEARVVYSQKWQDSFMLEISPDRDFVLELLLSFVVRILAGLSHDLDGS